MSGECMDVSGACGALKKIMNQLHQLNLYSGAIVVGPYIQRVHECLARLRLAETMRIIAS